MGISQQEDFHWPEIPLQKMWEIDNEAKYQRKPK